MKRALWLLLCLAGCGQILDLEDPKLVTGDAAAPTADGAVAAPGCPQYCTDALELCPAGDPAVGTQIFELRTHCEAVCAAYPVGDPANPAGNTLACRSKLLTNARTFGEAATICQAAGPGGASFHTGTSCGTDCEGFCNLRVKVCGDNEEFCKARCPAIPDPQANSYNAGQDFKSGKDTYNCRMAHLATAAAYQAAGDNDQRSMHCDHSGLKSVGPCDLKASEAASCKDYCQLVAVGCSGASQVYESVQQCEAVCAKMPNAENDSKTGNTVRCRREQAYAALTNNAPTARLCEAAGPVPLECGGSKCEAFCSLLLSTCGTEGPFKTQAECVANCDQLTDSKANEQISLATAKDPDKLSCRVLNLMKAASGDVRQCVNAFGTGTCK